ncbi:MAG: sterol desaturase/sphingolipid hydroxylase (fatty acid hydroxylase superfamily) [Kiritimatiellia bacterium]|jgi:sterol desaturase/sphingolipid hydroxylase (fatty acid hydroxylase superfamily)
MMWWVGLVSSAVLGVLCWSFLEYVIHRWLGHHPAMAGNPFGKEHIAHHARGDYFAANWKKGLAALGVLAVVAPPAVLLVGWGPGLCFSLGLVGFYLYYEALHRLEHVWRGAGPYSRWARKHHFYHHFHDPRKNHGVTSPVWDVVFGTYVRVERVRVPTKLAMTWLTDPKTGKIWTELQGDYELRVRRPRAA